MSTPPFKPPPKLTYTGKDGRREVYIIHEELGRGGFGYVYRATQQNTNKEYAIKMITKQFLNSQNLSVFEKLKNELKIQRALNHPNIVKSKMSFSDESNYYIVLEYCPGLSIREYLKNSANGYLTEPETRKILRDVIKGLIYLHGNNVIHHDIKLENFIIGANGIVKIADFGLSTILDNQKKIPICGTINYIAPEVLKKEGNGFEVDIWAIGVAAFIMLTGQAPFGNSKEIIYKNILSCFYGFPSKSQVSPEARNFVKAILKLNPKDRPTAVELSNLPFMKILDNELIDFYRPIQKVRSSALLQIYPKVQSLKQVQYGKSSNSSSDSIAADRLPQDPPQKVRPPIPLQPSQKVRSPTPQKIPSRIPLQGSQKIRSQILLQSSQKVDLMQKIADENKIELNLNLNQKMAKSNPKLRSSSVSNPRRTKQPISSELNYNDNNNNEVNLIRHSSSSSRKSSASNAKKNFIIPNTFVNKFCIYDNEMGYLLGNGIVGTCFKDTSRIVMDPSESFIQYYKTYDSPFETISLKPLSSSLKDNLKDKISLVMRFNNTFKKSRTSTDTSAKNISPSVALFNVKFFMVRNDSFLFKFCDKNTQVNFGDHTKMIIFQNTKKICYLRSMTDRCSLLDLKDVASMSPDTDERQKFKLAKVMLNDLTKKVQSQIEIK